eukprot:SAG31_NODE_799_length_12017_cov_5.478436_4_plen_122_part_00
MPHILRCLCTPFNDLKKYSCLGVDHHVHLQENLSITMTRCTLINLIFIQYEHCQCIEIENLPTELSLLSQRHLHGPSPNQMQRVPNENPEHAEIFRLQDDYCGIDKDDYKQTILACGLRYA